MTISSRGNYEPDHCRLRTFYDVVAKFRDGSDTPTAYLERCLETIDKKEPEVRAWVVLDIEKARIAANESTARYQAGQRSEEHTSELQSLVNLVCRLLLEKKKT